VQPFVKSNKNDYRDAEAIAEALERENMRFCVYESGGPARPASSASGTGAVGFRDGRVSLIRSDNQIRSFLLKRGISFRKGPANLRRRM
jgi:transposase